MATIRGKLGHLECLCRACPRDGIDFQLTKLRSSHRSALSGDSRKKSRLGTVDRINDLRRCGPFCRESLPYPYFLADPGKASPLLLHGPLYPPFLPP